MKLSAAVLSLIPCLTDAFAPACYRKCVGIQSVPVLTSAASLQRLRPSQKPMTVPRHTAQSSVVDVGSLVSMDNEEASQGNENEFDSSIGSAFDISTRIEIAIESGDLAAARRIFDESDVEGNESLRLTILNAHTLEKYADMDAASEAEAWLDSATPATKATSVSYNVVLKAWKASKDPSAPQRAKSLLERMEDMGLADIFSYSTYIAIHADRGSAKEAMDVIARMKERGVDVNTEALNAVINACVKSGDAESAEAVLDQMETAYFDGDDKIGPTVFSYSNVMHGWSKMQNDDSFKRVEDVFRRQKTMFDRGNEKARPNRVSYITLIGAMCQSGMPERAEDTLRHMYELYKEDSENNPKPNVRLISDVIDSWQKSNARDAGERAEKLLEWMISEYQATNDPSLRPNEYSFASAITAWAKTRQFGKSKRARALLVRMRELFEEGVIASPPNAYCYTSVLNSCAYCERDDFERRTALATAVTTYQELLQSKHTVPNYISFATMIAVLQNATPPSDKRLAAVSRVFHQCAELGCVAPNVLKRLQSVVSDEDLIGLVGKNTLRLDGNVDMAKLPEQWTKNAPVQGKQWKGQYRP